MIYILESLLKKLSILKLFEMPFTLEGSLHVPNKKAVLIEDVSLEIPFPKCVKTATLSVNVGAVLYDEATKAALPAREYPSRFRKRFELRSRGGANHA